MAVGDVLGPVDGKEGGDGGDGGGVVAVEGLIMQLPAQGGPFAICSGQD